MMRPTDLDIASLGRLGVLLLVMVSLGCRSAGVLGTASLPSDHRLAAIAPTITEAQQRREDVKFLDTIARQSSDPALDEIVLMFRKAEATRHRKDPKCVALYAEVALSCWPLLPSSDETQFTEFPIAKKDAAASSNENSGDLTWLLYHRSVERLTQEAARYGLLDPQRGISIVDADGTQRFIEITRDGFPWQPEDFNQLHVIRSPLRSHLKRYWSDPGLGVPMVAIRERSVPTKHLGRMIPYSATGVLRPADRDTDSKLQPVSYRNDSTLAVLELHDPLRVTEFSDESRQWDLARDVSAPLGFARSHLNRNKVRSFLNPARDDEFSGLRMLEPYQPGKIPIVFVHGLLSDRLTWLDLINDLRHSAWMSEHFQIWLYQYPTGQPFIISAAAMRNTLRDAVQELDPQGTDPAISEMVLIGHSMGGLVSKLLITSSQDDLWESVARLPIDEVKIAPEKRSRVESIFFFEPLPFVKRVIFIGTPHQGSKLADSWVGVLGSSLVHRSREKTRETKTVLHDNPGVFKNLEKHLPTSVDLLRPENPILLAAYPLHVNPAVKLHTIIGTGHPLRDGTDADGVVPVESARHPHTVSESLIQSNHTGLPDHPDTTKEVARILAEHYDLVNSAADH